MYIYVVLHTKILLLNMSDMQVSHKGSFDDVTLLRLPVNMTTVNSFTL